jgi:putative membrane protein insertion efficiency factor
MYSDSDPRSWAYERKYSRPKLQLGKVFASLFLVTFSSCAIYIILIDKIHLDNKSAVFLSISFLVLIFAINAKTILIWCVKAYQRFAPISVRCMCRFEPSCSEYMILSLSKYGAVKGVVRGISRIWRCAHKDGGFDFP